jgi:hypothetical protein
MIENVTTALQVNAATGNGLTVTLPESRFVTFRVTGNGSVTPDLWKSNAAHKIRL